MIYAFDDIVLDTRRQILTRNGTDVKTEPQVFDLLHFLIENADRLVTKDEIIDAVWQGRAISDTAIASRISSARKALGDNGKQQRIIKTVHNRGLRFLGKPKVDHQKPIQTEPPQEKPKRDKPSVIVMPFRARPDNEVELFTADALVDEISALLTAMEGMNIIPRRAAGFTLSVTQDPIVIARDLGAQYVVTGHVRREGDRLRVRAMLTDLADNQQLWTDKFNGTMHNIFDIEDKVTTGVIGALGGKIAHIEAMRISRQPPDNLEAWEFARRALSVALDWRPETMTDSIKSCRKAVELDPNYAQAHGYLGFFLAWEAAQGWAKDPKANRAAARHHTDKAYNLTHRDGEVLSAIGDTYRVLGEPEKAVAFYENAKAQNPDVFNMWPVSLPIMGIAYAQAGQDNKARQAVSDYQRKFTDDSLGRIWSRVSLGYIELCARNYARVEDLHANPPSEYNAMCRIIALVKLSRLGEARSEYGRLKASNHAISLDHYIAHFTSFHIDPAIGAELSEALGKLKKSLQA